MRLRIGVMMSKTDLSKESKMKSTVKGQSMKLALLALSLSSSVGWAATQTGASTSVIKAQEVAPKKNYNDILIRHDATLTGPNVSTFDSHVRGINGEFQETSTINIENWSYLGYRFSKDFSLAAVAQYTYRPVLSQDITMRDPFIKAAFGNIINSDGFSLSGDLRAYLPTSRLSQDNKMVIGLRNSMGASYDIPGSRVSLGAATRIRLNTFSTELADKNQQDIYFYLGPSVSYKISNTVSAVVLYEMQAGHYLGTSLSSTGAVDVTDLQPGISWDVTPNLNLNPFVNFYTGGKILRESTYLGLNLSATLL